MKKSVVILIALIYVASIALVGFLGLKANTYNEVVYVESIEILSSYSVDRHTGDKFITFMPQGDERSIQINARCLPDDASDKNIVFTLDKTCTVATVDGNGLLTFVEDVSVPVSVTLYIYSYQNPTISDEIVVYYIP